MLDVKNENNSSIKVHLRTVVDPNLAHSYPRSNSIGKGMAMKNPPLPTCGKVILCSEPPPPVRFSLHPPILLNKPSKLTSSASRVRVADAAEVAHPDAVLVVVQLFPAEALKKKNIQTKQKAVQSKGGKKSNVIYKTTKRDETRRR